jgi:hypothetical protein
MKNMKQTAAIRGSNRAPPAETQPMAGYHAYGRAGNGRERRHLLHMRIDAVIPEKREEAQERCLRASSIRKQCQSREDQRTGEDQCV